MDGYFALLARTHFAELLILKIFVSMFLQFQSEVLDSELSCR